MRVRTKFKYLGKAKNAWAKRRIRHARIRNRVYGTQARPRLAVFRSLRHISAQVIDDGRGHTLVSASDMESSFRGANVSNPKSDVAVQVGALLAERTLAEGIDRVVFDRGGYRYHGRVRLLADAVRKGGVAF